MDGLDDLKFNCTRRHFLSASSLGIGSTALAALLDPSLLTAAPALNPLVQEMGANPASDLAAATTGWAQEGRTVLYLLEDARVAALCFDDLFELARQRETPARILVDGARHDLVLQLHLVPVVQPEDRVSVHHSQFTPPRAFAPDHADGTVGRD
jgi:hypothetical protein